MNFAYLDVETTGRFADKHDIIQLACIPIINGVRQQSFNEYCQPSNYETVESEAIKVHGITISRMKTFQSQKEMLDKFIEYMKSFDVKFIIAGFNVGFDKKFISTLFSRLGKESDFFSLFELQVHDVFSRARQVKKHISSENLKLSTLAKHFNIEICAHDAISDISATIDVDKNISKLLNESEFIYESKRQDIIVNREFLEPAQLHVHSMYGMVESIPSVEDWAEWCMNNDVPGFSVVDHGIATSVYKILKINNIDPDTKTTKYKGVVGIPGVGLYLSPDLKTEKLYSFNVWATSNVGYFNLIKLSSLAYNNFIEVDGVVRPRLIADDLVGNMEGLMFGTSDVYDEVGSLIKEGNVVGAEEAFKQYVDVFGNRLLVEFIPISIRSLFSTKTGFQPINKNSFIVDGDWNKAYNIFLSKMVDKHGLKCIPSSGAHFINKEDKLLQDCVCRNSYSSQKCYSETYSVRKAKEIFVELKHQLGDWLSEDKFASWIQNTYDILEAAKSIHIKHDYHLPKIPIPKHIQEKTDDYDKQLYFLAFEKCIEHGRWNDDPIYVNRFKKEIDVIMKNEKFNFLPYFLIYEDICAYARSQDILQNIARGSAGGCLLSYYLKIIHIDPIKEELPFERFLSHARIRAGSFPDVDLDVGNRVPILKYLEEKYGDGFAQICVIQKMKTKNAIKDAMFALYGTNREDPNVKNVCELIPDSPQGVDEYDFLYGYLDKEETYHPGAVEICEELATFFKMYPAVEELVKKLVGLPRSFGRHASAFVISTLKLSSERIPTMKIFDKKVGEFVSVTQLDAPGVEGSGLIKADILGLSTIDMVSDCIQLVKERTGIDYLEEEDGVASIYRLPEDEAVYVDFYNKDTDSSFQFNTSLIKSGIQQFAPTSKKDLSALTALYRPGAMDAPLYDTTATKYYVDVRNGKRDVELLHEDLSFLRKTHGVFVYQELIMKFLVDIVGYSWEESDVIRGAIAKKKHNVIMSTFSKIRESCHKRGWSDEAIETVCQQVQAFSRYSFNLAHSRAYSELGYITMYLKHHHKLEWWTSVLNRTHKDDKFRHYMGSLSSSIQSPSLSSPTSKFTIIGDKIVAPLSILKSVGNSAIDEIMKKAPFTSLEDYVKRVAHNKANIGHVGSMIKGRAFDCFMDENLPYSEARKKLMDDYICLRNTKSVFSPDLQKTDPISVFLMEKEINSCFNKSLLDDKMVYNIVTSKINNVSHVGGKNIPMFIDVPAHKKSKEKTERIPIASNLKVAQNMKKNGYDGQVGLILLFEESSHSSGISKRTQKEWHRVDVFLTDGFSSIKCNWWDKEQALGWNKNSIVFVRGTLFEGWGASLGLNIISMERID